MAKNFDNPYSADVVGLWDFRSGYETDDSGLGDGIAQDGTPSADATFGGGWLFTNGGSGRMDVDDGDDASFDLTEGSLTTSFRPYSFGPGDQTVVSRGLADTPDEFFEIRVTPEGAVELYHGDDGASVTLATDPSFLVVGDIVNVTYGWGDDGVTLIVENETQGTSTTVSSDVSGLSFDITGDDEQSFVFGARETTEGTFDQGLDGSIDYVAVLNADVTGEGLDGIVEGTEGDDLIDTAYLGDPEGDRIDAGDAIDPTVGPDDDLVHAGGGDDTVEAGAGDDTVHGGSGSDSLVGGAGDDVLEGDTDAPGAGATTREVFKWDLAPDPDDASLVDNGDELDGGFDQDTGNVNVSYSVTESEASLESAFDDRDQYVGNIDTGGDAADANSSLRSNLLTDGQSAEHALDFSDPVENVSFRVNDIDGGGVVHVTAFDANGDPVKVVLAGGPALTMSDDDSVAGDDTARASGNYAEATNTTTSLLVTIPGPVSRIVVHHSQDGDSDSGVFLTDVFFDATVADSSVSTPGDDTLDGGEGDDTLIGNEGDDSLTGGDGRDSADGGDGDDYIDTSGSAPAVDRGFPGYDGTTPAIPAITPDADPLDDRDTVTGGAGNDTIYTGDDNDLIDGGAGDDFIDAGIDDDTVTGGDGNDEIIGSEGSDSLMGGAGDDTIYGGLDPDFPDGLNITDDGSDGRDADPDPTNGRDTIDGGDGNDLIYGQDDDDLISGGAGDDTIDAGIDDDTVDGGAGADVITGGHGADSLSGGDDRDTFMGATDGDTIDGGSGGDDYDILDLTGQNFEYVSRTADADGNSYSGTINLLDGDDSVIGTFEFSEIEQVIPCFTPGTLIATPQGERRVEELQVGDRIITRDNGIQAIRWVGHRELDRADLAGAGHLQPVLIRQGALGNGLPERDMMVSPNHRVLVANDKTALYFEDREVLVAAKHLTGLKGVDAVETSAVTYIHFMFDQHEVVLSDGAWTESFQPGDLTLRGLDNAQRNEIFELFPELKTDQGRAAYSAARRSLKKHEAKLLLH
ncbi:Hint domain-containing protein [Tritonibacter horizontis]|uniref:Bifunctional hemolysin/adenylate cyclase n=1 Tax=Tritonibacter horizontis TaxID=1768241 RepID=A0A132BZZ2_9RHOB|nr:Hint domain-containing protein [Tritonibacter horizontis]KUP93925.1 bifunctional hemolysin/adenylate cyclase precursor [Tritonibacter horizontis]